MKRITSFGMTLVLLLLVGCNGTESEKSTRFFFDTVVSLDIECDKDTLEGAFSLCDELESLLSKTRPESDVSRLNFADGFVKVSKHTRYLIERSVYYGDISGGSFDITLCPVVNLWDFEGTALPDKKEIAEALKNVDYTGIRTDGELVDTGGRQIDLGGIAKGYIADLLSDYFSEKKIKAGIINLGGDVVVFGDRTYDVGIKKPFGEGELSAVLRLKNKSAVTSGVYERYIEKDGRIYHHILDPKTGYPVETDLYSATVIGDASVDCDALATVCILLGRDKATELIEKTPDLQAVFIDRDGSVTYTSGLKKSDGVLILK